MELMGSATLNMSRLGIVRVDGNAARVAGASKGSASDQGKGARVGASEHGKRTSFMPLEFARYLEKCANDSSSLSVSTSEK
jgi:hypothetical protein